MEALKNGCEYALKNRLVTFGIIPTSAETGFGYIKSEKSLNSNEKGLPINKFIEKPSKEVAEKLIKDDLALIADVVIKAVPSDKTSNEVFRKATQFEMESKNDKDFSFRIDCQC